MRDNYGIQDVTFGIEEQQVDGRRILALSGELDPASAPALIERVEPSTSSGF